MKKNFFSAKALLMLIAVLFSLTGAKAETLTVYGNATDDSDYVPVYGFYGDAYNKCEFVVPASELNAMEGGTISQMTFYLKSPANEEWTGAFQVFLKEVDYTAISEFSGTEGATVVYEGTLDGTQSTMTINFSKNHVYKGGNLLVGVYQTATGNYKKATFTGADVDNSSITGYNYSNLDKITPTQRDFIPKTTFTYTPSSGVYAKPKDLTISNLTAHEVTISWTAPAGTVSGYAYQLKKETEEWGTEETTITDASVTLTGLKAGGAYNFRVKALYGENASVYVSVNFTTDCDMATLPFEESWDDGIGCWTVVNNSSPDNAPSLDVTDGNNIFSFSSYNGADVYDQFLISPEFDGSKAIDLEFNYCASSPNGTEYFRVGYSTTTNNISAFTWGEQVKTEETSWALWEGTFPQGTKYVAIHYTSNYSYHLYVDNLLFTEHSDLIKPTDLAVSELFGKSAKLSWTENGTATAWQICLNGDLDNLIAADSNPFTLTGLTPETDYVASVRAVEGDNASKWSEGVQFTTGPLYTAPTDLTVEPLATSATVSWWCNPEATSFVVQYAYLFTHSGPIWITAEGNANPCILEGLTPETTYHVRVKAIYGTEGESTWTVTKFTTMNINPIPWDVVVTPGSTTATIEWTGISDSYEVKYRTASFSGEASFFENFENGLGAWTVYTDGEAPQADGWYTIDPSNNLIFYAHSGTACASSWSWSDVVYEADNWLVTPQVTFKKLLKFWVRTNPSYADSYEVLLSTTGNAEKDFTVTLQAKTTAPAIGEWTEVVIDLSDYTGQEGYIAIHHIDSDQNYLLIDDFGIYAEDTPAGDWVTVPTTETSVELTGLEEATEYEYTIIGIKKNNANEGTAIASFTTLISNPVPFNIAADLAADGATLTWEGKGESYNVRYRVAANRNVFYEENFEGGEIPKGWTTVDNDGDGFNWDVITNYGEPVSGLSAMASASFDKNANSPLTPDNWLISPQLDLKGTLGIWLSGMDESYAAEHFAIYLSTEGNTIDDFLTTELVPKKELVPETIATGEFIEYIADLSAYEGQKGYIAIRHFNVTDMFYLVLDDFSIFEPIPAGEWQEMAVNEATASFDGLITNNAYEYQIQSVKGDATSEWSEINDFALLTIDSNADNYTLISKYDGKQAYVTLANRTFNVDDTWNTICLPFDLTDAQIAASPLTGADIRSLSGITIQGDVVTLNFYPETDIVGGYPNIIKWAPGSDIVNPEFANVTITKEMYLIGAKNTDESVGVYFIGTYAKMAFTADDPSILFVGNNNKLNYPLAGASVGACRCYFELHGITADGSSTAKQYVLSFGDDDATSLDEELRAESDEGAATKEWYDLSGRKLSGKPSVKGIYVNGGRKVILK